MVSNEQKEFISEVTAWKPDVIVSRLKSQIDENARDWKLSVLETIAEWPLARETIAGRGMDYLIAGEAFDWRLLAERLLDACSSKIENDIWWEWLDDPALFGGFAESEFMRAVGVDKFRAHLSYFYGVTVEQALLISVEEEITHIRVASGRELSDVSLERTHELLYGNTRGQLWEVFSLETGLPSIPRSSRRKGAHSLASDDAFTYWLFKLRMERSDPAKIASDTRKGLVKLERMRQNNDRRKILLHSDELQSHLGRRRGHEKVL